MSKDRSWRPSDSTTIGTSALTGDLLLDFATVELPILYATRRLPMDVEREILLDAPPEEVWEALTDPEQLEEWFANDVEFDLERGGVFRWDDGETRHAVVEEAVPERRLALRWWDPDGHE